MSPTPWKFEWSAAMTTARYFVVVSILLGILPLTHAEWSSDIMTNTPVCTENGTQYYLQTVSDGAGWRDHSLGR